MRVKPFLKSAAHQHKDPQVRLAHVETLDPGDEASADALATFATEDEDAAVRVAAIARVRDLAVLRELLDASGDGADGLSGDGADVAARAASEAAERRLGTMFEGGEVSDVAVRALLDTHAARLAPLVAASSPVPAQRERALAAIEDEHALVGVIQSSRLHDARLAAAERLSRHDTMRAALAACRVRDKVVAKQLQQRLDAEAAAEAARIAARHAVTSTLESMRTLGTSVWSPQSAGRAQALRERWAALATEDTAADDDAFAAADARVQALLDEHAAAVAADADGAREGGDGDADGESTAARSSSDGESDGSPSGAAADGSSSPEASEGAPSGAGDATGDGRRKVPQGPPADEASVALAATLTDVGIDTLLAAVDGEVPDAAPPPAVVTDTESSGTESPGTESGDAAGTSPPSMGAASAADSPSSEALRAHARSVAVLFDPPFDHQKARPGALTQRLRRVEALLDTESLLPGLDLASHRYLRELAEHRDALAERLARSKQESADRVKSTHRQFAALGGIIGEGKWTPANILFKRLQKKLAAMEPAERAGLDDKLARAEQQLAEMGDWQDFAARPKLEALCAEMEALPARELVPDKLAKEVRDLQSQWKGLGPSRAANELWPRFKTAGDTAYEPCKAWFAAKGEERKAKVDARRAICEALEADVGMLGNALVIDPSDTAKPPRRRRRSRGKSKESDASAKAPAGENVAADGAPSTDDGPGVGVAGGGGGASAGDLGVGSANAGADGAGDGVGKGTGGSDTASPENDSATASGVPDHAGADTRGDATDAEPDTASDGARDEPDVPSDGDAANEPTTDGTPDETRAASDADASGEEPAADGAADEPAADDDATPPEKPALIVVNPDGPEPDWKAVQRRVSDAKREWSANRVADRKPDRSLEGRFSAALKPYERALATRYEANEEEKRALIERAEALASGEITQHVANQAKSLLSAWKLVGIVPRRVDQALWETFNGHLGTIFRHQQNVVREKRRAGFEHVDRAKAISRELRALAKGASVDEAAVQKLADEFNALPEFPERDRRGLERDFRASLDATAKVQETAGKRRRQAEAEERLRLVGLCERLETAVEAPDEVADLATLRDDVAHAWEASETRVARDMATRLEARRDAALAHLEAGSGYDVAANEEARRDLLIRMEVAADVETPPEDKSRRMRYQLENLQSGMTSAAVADRRATLAALEEEWLAAPPASRTVRDALHSRYLRAMGR